MRRNQVHLLCLLAWATAATLTHAQTEQTTAPGSLQGALAEAERLAKLPDAGDEAIAAYQSIIRTHQANEKVFIEALSQLTATYEASGRIEDGARFIVGLAREMESSGSRNPFREVFSAFLLKHKDVVQRVAQEMQAGSDKPLPEPVPSQDLAKAIMQREDKTLREQALAELREVLSPQSTDASKLSGLATLRAAMTAQFDRASFRTQVLPLLTSDDLQIRQLAVSCLPGLEATVTDLVQVVPLAEDPSPHVRAVVGGR